VKEEKKKKDRRKISLIANFIRRKRKEESRFEG